MAAATVNGFAENFKARPAIFFPPLSLANPLSWFFRPLALSVSRPASICGALAALVFVSCTKNNGEWPIARASNPSTSSKQLAPYPPAEFSLESRETGSMFHSVQQRLLPGHFAREKAAVKHSGSKKLAGTGGHSAGRIHPLLAGDSLHRD